MDQFYNDIADKSFLGMIVSDEQSRILYFDEKLKETMRGLNHHFAHFIDAGDIIGIKNLVRREKNLHMKQLNTTMEGRKYTYLYLFDLSVERQLALQLKEASYDAHLWYETFNQMKDAVLITDESNIVLFVNAAFTGMMGIPAASITGQSLEGSEFGREYCKSILNRRDFSSAVMEFEGQRKCLVSCSPVFDEDHNLKRTLILFKDLDDAELSPKARTVSLKTDDSAARPPASKPIDKKALNPAMKKIYREIDRLANVDTTILLTGETGVGKDFIAGYIHENSDRAKTGKLVKINCGAIPETLFESELFGYESGAFTGALKSGKIGYFESAANGTLYLDEIGEMPYLMQVKLLSALNDREFYRVGGTKPIQFTARVIAATNADLSALIKEKKFRSDLFYRINVITFEIPPLRDRREETLWIARDILQQYNAHYGKNCYFDPLTMSVFLQYNWTGNIREMKNLVERLVVTSPTDCIGIENIPDDICEYVGITKDTPAEEIELPKEEPQPAVSAAAATVEIPQGKKLRELVDGYEMQVLEQALKNSASLKEASEKLGVDISTIVRKKQKYKLP
ncbi:sigma 54-interacting transcriptional regulator [Christensenellaceae bacterium OttesenSCG-928-K19]|nr:sigma 54-interacting transcriptional regulator [Christensenellaceae bacterium OttesenSCG-928-K19]